MGHSRRFSDVRLKSAYPLEAAQERTFDHFRIRANFVLARTPYHTPKEPNRMKSLKECDHQRADGGETGNILSSSSQRMKPRGGLSFQLLEMHRRTQWVNVMHWLVSHQI
jgi:hypothetical protein